MENFSPSTNPHKIDTISIEYVTEEAKTGLDVWINLLNKTFAIAVAKRARIKT